MLEERIDHAELFEVQEWACASNHEIAPLVEKVIDALLTEHSAYRELKAYARDALTILENAHYPPFDQETSPDAIAVIEGLRAALLATESAQPEEEHVTHGRDCPCTPCKAEDWDEIERNLHG